jgi:hypothetical protein
MPAPTTITITRLNIAGYFYNSALARGVGRAGYLLLII